MSTPPVSSSVISFEQARNLLQVSQMLRGYVAGTGDAGNSQLFLKTAAALENRARNPISSTVGNNVDVTV